MDGTRGEAEREIKSLGGEETSPSDLDDDGALAARLLALAGRATADLREAGRCARTVTVKLRDADFRTRQAGRTLAEPVQSDRAVYAVARGLLAQLRAAPRVPAPLIGVSFAQLSPPQAHPPPPPLQAGGH